MAGALALTWAAAALGQAGPATVWDGAYTDAQAARGETAYLQDCASCHGTRLEGGEMSPALVGGTFTASWDDLTAGDLFERIRLTMPLDQPGKLTRQQNADIIAFVMRANGWPAGQVELPPESNALKQIRILAAKPGAN